MSFRVLITASVLVFLPTLGRGQIPPDTEGDALPPRLSSPEQFGSVGWGAGVDSIMAVWGSPKRVETLSSLSARALIFPDRSWQNERAHLGFLVHHRRGLVRGLLLLPYGRGSDCLRLYTRVLEHLQAAHPNFSAATHRDNPREDMDFCTAFQLGFASARALLDAPHSDFRIVLRLDLERGAVRVSYEPPAFAAVVGQ